MSAPVAILRSPDHWSLHKGRDRYELLAQVRPTDVYDAILLHSIGLRLADLLSSIVVHDGRVLELPIVIEVAWFRSAWRREEDGSITITELSVEPGALADDVMLLCTASLVTAGGAA